MEAPHGVPDPPDEQIVDDRLDELIPPTMSGPRKFVVSTILIGTTIGVIVMSLVGGFIPNHVFGGPTDVRFDEETGIFRVDIELQNEGMRGVRLTSIELEDPAVDVVRVGVEKVRGRWSSDAWSEDTLPVEMPVSQSWNAETDRFRIVVWFRVASCDGGEQSWGSLTATFDFGENGLPPFSTSRIIDTSAVWVDARVWGEDAPVFDNPLQAACELRQL